MRNQITRVWTHTRFATGFVATHLHKFESGFVGVAALHVAAVSHHITEALVNLGLAGVMGAILVNQIRDAIQKAGESSE